MTLLYIIGRGHSGTTMLDIALGHALEMRSTGELVSGLSRYPWQECSCGTKMQDCDHWSPAFSVVQPEAKAKKFCHDISSMAKIFGIWRVPGIYISKKIERTLSLERDFLEQLSGKCNGVIDSSKELCRGLLLALGPSKAKWLHVIRDPREVAQSARKRVGRGVPIKINRKVFYFNNSALPILDIIMLVAWSIWTVATFSLGKVLLRGNYILISYDNFVMSPAFYSKIIGERIGLEVSRQTIEERLTKIEVKHIVGGNRMAKEKKFRIEKKDTKSEINGFVRYSALFLSMPIYWLICKFSVRRGG